MKNGFQNIINKIKNLFSKKFLTIRGFTILEFLIYFAIVSGLMSLIIIVIKPQIDTKAACLEYQYVTECIDMFSESDQKQLKYFKVNGRTILLKKEYAKLLENLKKQVNSQNLKIEED